MSEHVKELLSDYMDDEITEMEKQMIETHLATCADCTNQLRDLMSIREQIFAAYQKIVIPSTIEDKVLEKIHMASIRNYSGILNRMAIIMLITFGMMFLITASRILTVGLPIFHSLYSIARGLIYAVPSIISAIPYVVEVITVLMLSFIAIAILTLRYLVHMMGKNVRVEDI